MTISLMSPREKNWSDDEQHAQGQQRALADRVAERLEDGQVDEDRGPEDAEDEAEPAEEVQRAVAVAAHERDREQIEEAAQVALEPVPGAAVLPRAVVDRQLGDAEAAVVR